jgi:hypothetical protein
VRTLTYVFLFYCVVQIVDLFERGEAGVVRAYAGARVAGFAGCCNMVKKAGSGGGAGKFS